MLRNIDEQFLQTKPTGCKPAVSIEGFLMILNIMRPVIW